MDHSAIFWGLGVVAAMLVGMSKGGIPVVGMLAVPLLSLTISPVTAAGLLLPVYVVSDMFGLYAYRHTFDRRILAIMAPGAALGVGLAWATASVVPVRAVTGLVGLIGLIFALVLIFRPRGAGESRQPRVVPGLFWGAAAGFTSFVSHAGAPPYQVYVQPLGLSPAAFAGTTTVFFAYVNLIKLPGFWALGQLSVENLRVAGLLMIPAVVAVGLGVWLVRRLPTILFYRLVTYALLAVSLRLLWQAAFG